MDVSKKIATLLCVIVIPLITCSAQKNPTVGDVEEMSLALMHKDYYQFNLYLKKLGVNRSQMIKDRKVYFKDKNFDYLISVNNNEKSKRILSFHLENYYAKENVFKYLINELTRTSNRSKIFEDSYFFYRDQIEIGISRTPSRILISSYLLKVNYNKSNSSTKSSGQVALNATKLTSVYLRKGEKIHLSASGRVTYGVFAGSGGPNGIRGYQIFSIVKNYPHGSLIGTIGENGSWFYVGREATITADQSGYLKLYVNDIDPGNNTGRFVVKYEKR